MEQGIRLTIRPKDKQEVSAPTNLNFRPEPEQGVRLYQLARDTNRHVSELLRMALAQFLDTVEIVEEETDHG